MIHLYLCTSPKIAVKFDVIVMRERMRTVRLLSGLYPCNLLAFT